MHILAGHGLVFEIIWALMMVLIVALAVWLHLGIGYRNGRKANQQLLDAADE